MYSVACRDRGSWINMQICLKVWPSDFLYRVYEVKFLTQEVFYIQSEYSVEFSRCFLTYKDISSVLICKRLLLFENALLGRKDGSVVKSTCCSSRGPEFHSQHLLWRLTAVRHCSPARSAALFWYADIHADT